MVTGIYFLANPETRCCRFLYNQHKLIPDVVVGIVVSFSKQRLLGKFITILSFLLVFYFPAIARDISFFHLSTADGLSDNLVSSVVRDKSGMLWIATAEGLNSYDGYTVRKYYKEDYPTLTNNNLSSLFLDDSDRIWLRDVNGKIILIDERRNFIPVPVLENGKEVPALAFFETNSRGICILSGNKIFKLSKDKPYKFEKIIWAEDISLFRGYVMVRSENSDTITVIGTNKLCVFDTKTMKVLHTVKVPGIIAAAWLNDHELLVSTQRDRELLKVDLKKEAIIHNYRNLKDQYGEYIYGYLRHMRRFPDGRFIISSGYAGIYLFDAENEKIERYSHDPLNVRSISADNTQHVITDNSGYVYITTRTSGLNYFNINYHAIIYRSAFRENSSGKIFHGFINCITRHREGNFWLGAQTGLIEWNREKNTVKFHDYGTVNNIPLKGVEEVRALIFDKQERLWVGLNRYGLTVLDKSMRVIKYISADTNMTPNNLPRNWINSFTLAPDNKIWVATSGGLSIIQPEKLSVEKIEKQNALKPLEKIGCFSFWFRNEDEVWIATSGGAYQYIKSLNRLTRLYIGNGLSSNVVYGFAGDKKGTVFIGTSKGLNLVKDTTVVKIYRRQNGLLNDRCYGMIPDADDNIWIGNDNILVKYNTSDSSFTGYDESAGLNPSGFRQLSFYQSPDGEQCWGSDLGLSYFIPGQLEKFELPLGVRISSFSAGGVNYPYSGNEQIKVPWKKDNLQFSFSAIDLFGSKNILYEYLLAGADDDWRRTNSPQQVSYSSLSPGLYRFRVRASRDGINWIEAGNSFSIRINTPWWKSGWFILSVMLAVLTMFAWWLHRRNNLIKQQREQLETEKAINYFASSIYEQQTVDDILWDVARNCIGQLNFEDAVIYLKDEEKNVLVQKAAWGPKTTAVNKIIKPIEIPLGKGIVGAVGQSGKAEIIEDTSGDGRYIVDDVRRLSEIAVPIVYNNNVLGVIDSEHSKKNFFTAKHLSILTAIASLCANKIMRNRAEEAKQKAQLELLNHQRKMAEVQLKSLRLQMSPHFLFNALNSIQQIILSGNDAAATRYLSKFSRLLRLVLQHSDKEKISLKEEAETLNLYLELESLRFEDSFVYAVNISASADADEIKIPTLLVQPFVENAIWHGLLHKEGERRLTVNFSEDGNDNLICTVEDNGIGRIASRQMSNQEIHTGKGLAIAEERIKTFNEQHRQQSTFTIQDLYDEKKTATGTKIAIVLPLIK